MNLPVAAPGDRSRVRCPVCGAPAARRRLDDLLACAACGLRFTASVDQATIARVYGDLARSGRAGAIESCRRSIYAAALAIPGLPRGGRCLDVGCGAGEFVAFARTRGFDVIGVDPAAASSRAGAGSILVSTFPCADLLGDARFELVTFFNSLNYFEDPVAALAEARRLLRPGGSVLVRVPNGALHAMLRRPAVSLDRIGVGTGWLGRLTQQHPRSFSRRSLAVAFSRAGLVDTRVQGSVLSDGDPYELGVPGFRLAKRALGLVAGALARCSGNRLLCSSSLIARGRRGDASAPATERTIGEPS